MRRVQHSWRVPEGGAGVVRVKKLLSGDIAVQLKEREDKLA